MDDKITFYNIRHLFTDYPKAYYYMVIGERSNGKTYSAMDYCLERYIKYGEQFAYIRRFQEDIKKSEMDNLFSAHMKNGRIEKLSQNRWNGMYFYGGKFVLQKEDGFMEDRERDSNPCGYVFHLTGMEHYKSIAFPDVTTIVFDEFLSRRGYLPNEFMLFTNMLSTIIRYRNNVRILMLGNTVNKYCPYFAEMGLTHVKEQKQGTVDVYQFPSTGLEIAVEYCKPLNEGKKSDVYFAFDNPQLKMITTGEWEIAVYPHLPIKYKPKDVALQFFIEFDRDILHCEVISTGESKPFLFVHPKTTGIKDEKKDIVYREKPSHRPNIRVGFGYADKLTRFILSCIKSNAVFFSDNETGEVFRNYVLWSGKNNLLTALRA